ncbi:MAG TPA: YbjQ family protein [Nitrosopumilaceae archaeon]|nr:YbjQ family protein [Nitrosopumilaceae archaeon]
MEKQKFGDPEIWKRIRNKLENGKSLDDEEYNYYKKVGNEYIRALENKKNWGLEQIEKLEQELKDYTPENILYNIDAMEEQEFGDSKIWKKIRKKLENGQPLDVEDYGYYKKTGIEYTNALQNKRQWRLEQIEELQREGIGENDRWEILKQKLKKAERLSSIDLEYYSAKFREYEQGVITTTYDVHGREIVSYLGIVSGQAVIGLMFLKDIVMGLTDTFGGRSGILERNFRTAKDSAIKQMSEEAQQMGANAVVGVSVNFSPIEGKNKEMLMVIATGTAVITRAKN